MPDADRPDAGRWRAFALPRRQSDVDDAVDDAASTARALQVAGEQLREHLDADSPPSDDFPVQFLLMGTSRLLEEIARSVTAGHPIDEPVLRVAVDIAHHVEHYS